MHVNTLLVCDYTSVTLKRPSNDASDRRRVKSSWEAMPDLLYAQRSGWIIERQNQRYDKSHALKRRLHACIRAVEYIERTSLQHATPKHLDHSQYTQNMTRIKSMAGEKSWNRHVNRKQHSNRGKQYQANMCFSIRSKRMASETYQPAGVTSIKSAGWRKKVGAARLRQSITGTWKGKSHAKLLYR